MPASFESVRHDRRYEVDASGVTEFGLDRVLRQFIPWCSVDRIEFAHSRERRQVSWSVRATDGSRINPKLEYATSLECYRIAFNTWRSCMPQAFRSHFARDYRRWRRNLALMHLIWVIPAICVYSLVGLVYRRLGVIPWEELRALGSWIAMLYALCVSVHLLALKFIVSDFERWYALVEVRFNKLSSPSPVSSFGLWGWLFPLPAPAVGEEPITDEDRRVYQNWETASLLPFLLFFPLLSYGWYLVLNRGANLFHHEVNGTRFLAQPGATFLAMPALFLGLISSTISLTRLYRALLRGRYRRFERSCMERYGYDGRPLLACLVVILVIGSAAWFLAAVTNFARFTDTGIEIGRPFSLRTTFYEYSRAMALQHRATVVAPNGKTVERLSLRHPLR